MSTDRLRKALSKPTFDQIIEKIDKRHGCMSTDEWVKMFEDRKFKKFLAAQNWTASELFVRFWK